MAQSPADMSLVARLLFGGVFALPGIGLVAVAVGSLPVDPDSVHAPMWVIGTIGGMFALAGLWIMSAGSTLGEALSYAIGPVVLIGLLSVLHWVAFGPGVRQCSGGFSIPFLSLGRPVGDMECRLAFGYGAVLFDGILVGATLSSFAKKKLEGMRLRVVDGVASALVIIPLAPLILPVALIGLAKAAVVKMRGGSTAD